MLTGGGILGITSDSSEGGACEGYTVVAAVGVTIGLHRQNAGVNSLEKSRQSEPCTHADNTGGGRFGVKDDETEVVDHGSLVIVLHSRTTKSRKDSLGG